jgi:membrane protein required for colicin V production
MSSLDILVFAILAGSALLGLMRGLVKEVFSLAAWVLAFMGARIFGPQLAQMLPGTETPSLRYGLALVLVFILVLVGASLAGTLLAGVVKLAGLGAYDRSLGMAFGLLRGTAAVVALALLAGLTALPKTEAWQSAMSRAPLERAAQKVLPWLPRDLSVLIKYS